MAIIGTTDIGEGRYFHSLNHNPSSVATDGLRTSLAHDITTDYIWLKLDDGVTTNWINLRNAVNLLAGPFTKYLTGITNVGAALAALDDLNWATLPGGIGGGCVITQHNQTQPYMEVNAVTWQTMGAITFEGSTSFPVTKFVCVVSRSSSLGSSGIRLQDVTNNNTIAEITFSDESQHIETDDSLQNLPSSEAILEVQAIKYSGGKTNLWSAQLK